MLGLGFAATRDPEIAERLGIEDGASRGLVSEVILATNPNIEGETTAMYLARLLKQAGQAAPASLPTLEINAEHALVKKLDGSERFDDLAQILFDQAVLAEGGHRLLAAFRLNDELGRLAYTVYFYPSLKYDEDQRDNTVNAKRQQVQALMARAGFRAKGFFVMDGSRRSAHSNAFFTGFGASKRVVFFDTLLQQLSPAEMEAVLAHELGHPSGVWPFGFRHPDFAIGALVGGWVGGRAAPKLNPNGLSL